MSSTVRPRSKPKFTTAGAGTPTAQGYAIARQLRGYSRFWDSEGATWLTPEHRLWWAVIEATIVELGMGGSPNQERRQWHAEAVAAWRWRPLDEALTDCGIEPEFARRVVRRWTKGMETSPDERRGGKVAFCG